MSARGGPDLMRYARPLGWAAFAAAPILLAALAVASSRPDAPASIVGHAAWAAWIAAALAFVAASLHGRGALAAARIAGAGAALVVALFCAFLVWLSVVTHEESPSDTRPDRAETRSSRPTLAGRRPAGRPPSAHC